MALSYDQLSAISRKKYVPKMIDNIFDSDPLLQRLKKKGRYKRIDGGTSVMMPLLYAQTASAGWYDGSESLSVSDNEQWSSAEFQWKQCYANITIVRKQELQNMGEAAVLDLVKQKTMAAEKTLTDYLQEGLYSDGTNSKSIIGTQVFLSTSNTVGGISQSDYSWWQANVDTTTTTLNIAAMDTVYSDATINGKSPTVGLATRANWNRYHALLQPQQRFTDGETAKGGFQNLMYRGIPLIMGPKVPTGDLIFLNEENIALHVHKEEDFRFEPFAKPVDQNVKTAKIYWMGAFGTDQCRAHAALTALTA